MLYYLDTSVLMALYRTEPLTAAVEHRLTLITADHALARAAETLNASTHRLVAE